MRLIVCSKPEALATALADALRSDDPFNGASVIVQNRGMAAWLQQQIAIVNGACFLTAFTLPRPWLSSLFESVFPGEHLDDRFAPELLEWSVYLEIGRLDEAPPAGGELAHRFVSGQNGERRRAQLAARLAALFDSYLTFRPDLVLAWEAGRDWTASEPPPDASWQAELWRRVVRRIAGAGTPLHLARAGRRLLDRLRADPPAASLPDKLHAFGTTSLPPLYLEVFAALAAGSEVSLYRFEPAARLRRGNAFRRLANLGRSRAGFDAWAGRLGWIPLLLPAPARDPSLLSRVQRALVEEPFDPGTPPPPEDRSIQAHACHGPFREVEILREHLLHWFARGVRPHEVLVLAPQPEIYAPIAAAVFAQGEEPRIPFRIADRRRRDQSGLAAAVLHWLRLVDSRLEAPEVLEWLASPAVRRRFGFDGPGLDRIRRWARETPVWWGFDAADRTRVGAPGFNEGAWRHALDRLLAGYALGDEAQPFPGGAPISGVAGDAAATAGQLTECLERLERSRREASLSRSLSDWADWVNATVDELFSWDDEDATAAETLKEAVAQWRRAALAASAAPIPFVAIEESLRRSLERADSASGFLSGGVTVAALQPMRSVPSRVICVLGLNDDAFPRNPVESEYDLQRAHPEPGDESRPDDDRLLFLETIAAARETLYLSWVGQSPKDNSDLPPSAPAIELFDAVAAAWGEPARQRLITRHPLHSFSPAYFKSGPDRDDRLFSQSQLAYAAAVSQPSGAEPAFCPGPLPTPPDAERRVSLEELARFFKNPAREFLCRRLLFEPGNPEIEAEGIEPFAMGSLSGHRFRQELTEWLMSGKPEESLLARWAALDRLPPGPAGDLEADHLVLVARQLCARLSAFLPAGETESAPTVVQLGGPPGFEVFGEIPRRCATGVFHWRAGHIRSCDRAALWVEHLAYAATVNPGATSILAGWDKKEESAVVEQFTLPGGDPAALLQDLAAVWWDGIHRPAPLPPETAWAWASRTNDAVDLSKPWLGSDHGPKGEASDPRWRLCLGPEFDPQSSAVFKALAARIYEPLFRARTPIA